MGGPAIKLAGERSDLFGALGLQLMFAMSGSGGFVTCSGCGAPYAPRRQPIAGRRHHCQDCGRTAAIRDAQTRFRAQQPGLLQGAQAWEVGRDGTVNGNHVELVPVSPSTGQDTENNIGFGRTIGPGANPYVAYAESPFLRSSLELPSVSLGGLCYQAIEGSEYAAPVVCGEPAKILLSLPRDDESPAVGHDSRRAFASSAVMNFPRWYSAHASSAPAFSSSVVGSSSSGAIRSARRAGSPVRRNSSHISARPSSRCSTRSRSSSLAVNGFSDQNLQEWYTQSTQGPSAMTRSLSGNLI